MQQISWFFRVCCPALAAGFARDGLARLALAFTVGVAGTLTWIFWPASCKAWVSFAITGLASLFAFSVFYMLMTIVSSWPERKPDAEQE